ncbi:DUF6286 domain-containing protein [Corynebacterium liangguodongii]|uniref:DUF6286 domain-containing protein n=1 Tax=Corynebacterium liangguodongii TaxID=2079535 RepID=UPI0015D061D3|nr:DUF6286 domain-containing protein [Corynebacterium liangguodongii]
MAYRADSPDVPTPGPQPRALPAARALAILLSLALIGLSAVAGRDLWMRWVAGTPGDSWIAAALNRLAALELTPAMLVVGGALTLIGLWLVLAACAPRVRTHVRATSPASIWVRPVDIARRATYSARSVTGGSHISSQASRTRLKVTVEDDGSGEELRSRVTRALEAQFSPLAVSPRISVTLAPRREDDRAWESARAAENAELATSPTDPKEGLA